jgi:rubrerythrin
MTTAVGKQEEFCDALVELVELDYDAVEAYEAAINRLGNEGYKNMLEKFKQDHQRHITELSGVLKSHGEDVPQGPSAKQWLTKGKVVMANLVGDKAILSAMQTNEVDTNTAYERMNDRQDKWEDTVLFLKRGLEDEKRHKLWIDSQLT